MLSRFHSHVRKKAHGASYERFGAGAARGEAAAATAAAATAGEDSRRRFPPRGIARRAQRIMYGESDVALDGGRSL